MSTTATRHADYSAPARSPVGPERAAPTPTETWLIRALVAAGVALRLRATLSDASLYWGELAAARNIVARSFSRLLLERTAFGQEASYGYLLAQKAVVSLFGPSDVSLRFFSFLTSVIVLGLFVRLTRDYLEGAARVFAVGCLALGVRFVMINPTFKPLASVDVAATLGLMVLAHDLLVRPATLRRSLAAGVIGFLLMWFAEAAALVTVAVVIALIVAAIRAKDTGRIARLMPAFALWIAGAATAAIVTYMVTPPDVRASLHDLYASGAPPAFPHVKGEVLWLWDRLVNAAGREIMQYYAPWAFVVAMAVGIVPLVRRNVDMALLLLLPAVVTILAAAAGLYVFQSLYVAFLFPAFFIFAAAGLDVVRALLARAAPTLGTAWMAACFVIPVWAIVQYPPPYRVEETRPVLAYVRDHRQPGDAIYGFFAASHALAFYGPRYGMQPADVVMGDCHYGEARQYFAELDRFRGRPRLWLIFTHDLPRYRARNEIVNYLNHIGTQRDSIVVGGSGLPSLPSGAWAYLYDLSDSTKLASMTAAAMPLLRNVPADQQYRCGVGLISPSEKP